MAGLRRIKLVVASVGTLTGASLVACSLAFPTDGFDLPPISPDGAAFEGGDRDRFDIDAGDELRTDGDPRFVCNRDLACDPNAGAFCCASAYVDLPTLYGADSGCYPASSCGGGSVATCRDLSDCAGSGQGCCAIFLDPSTAIVARVDCLTMDSCRGPGLRPLCVIGGAPCDPGRACVASAEIPGFSFCQ